MTTELAIKQIQEQGIAVMPKSEEESLTILKTCATQYYNAIYPKTFNDVFHNPSCTLGKFSREVGQIKGMALMSHMLIDLVKFLNVGKSMNAEQVRDTANILLNDYAYLKVEDFKLCFNKVKKGLYGQTYDRIDGQVITGWINKYIEERLNAADELSYKEHESSKYGDSESYSKRYFETKN